MVIWSEQNAQPVGYPSPAPGQAGAQKTTTQVMSRLRMHGYDSFQVVLIENSHISVPNPSDYRKIMTMS